MVEHGVGTDEEGRHDGRVIAITALQSAVKVVPARAAREPADRQA
jgi:hypothetical protein